MLTAEQLEIRRRGIGGSDAAAIVGLDTYRSAVDVWMDKLGLSEEQDMEPEPAYWGNVLEEVVAREFERRSGLPVRRHTATMFHPKYHWMLAHIDRRITGQQRGLECKTINAFAGWKLDQPLEKHLIQVQHYMAVTGFEMFHVAYLIGGQRFAMFEVPRDQELIDMLIDAEADFWQHVETRTEPPFNPEHPRAEELLRRMYPGTDGGTIVLDDSMEHWHQVRMESTALARKYDAAADVAKCHILHAMGEAAIGVLPDGSCYRRKIIERQGYEVAPSSCIDFRHCKKTNS
jgi:putative phage-type endonuclease